MNLSEVKAWILLLVVPVVVVALALWVLPPRHNPFSPVDLSERPGLGTWHKLTRIKKDREVCFTALDDVGVAYTPVEDSAPGIRCNVRDALVLGQSMTPYSATLKMTCAQTAAVYTWERHVARPAALELLGSPIAQIETYGSFSCRNVAGTSSLSQHGYANAIDISGFKLADGRRISVLKHWNAGGPEARFLRRLHDGACGLFSVTLGPDYNAAHADHFHFDMGSARSCR